MEVLNLIAIIYLKIIIDNLCLSQNSHNGESENRKVC